MSEHFALLKLGFGEESCGLTCYVSSPRKFQRAGGLDKLSWAHLQLPEKVLFGGKNITLPSSPRPGSDPLRVFYCSSLSSDTQPRGTNDDIEYFSARKLFPRMAEKECWSLISDNNGIKDNSQGLQAVSLIFFPFFIVFMWPNCLPLLHNWLFSVVHPISGQFSMTCNNLSLLVSLLSIHFLQMKRKRHLGNGYLGLEWECAPLKWMCWSIYPWYSIFCLINTFLCLEDGQYLSNHHSLRADIYKCLIWLYVY